CQKYSTPPYSF
nr:immunoglobulin light chain junction region [Macaca mulatta]MOW33896.1 immunoglobulin light chain junction region [Macaca mulatta]MOW34099.1 immunoglobulin light chain junction region [Macaca mulatta]MOW34100.1 immunoglobulin light chain junction region [Macaca mulatta]MOW34116.1 immunoglobulin light chain junction region [Macaca mulatta]